MIHLTPEQMAVVEAHPEGGWFVGPNGERIYYVQDANALRDKKSVDQMTDHEAIAAGIADLEAGRVSELAATDARIRQRLGFPPAS